MPSSSSLTGIGEVVCLEAYSDWKLEISNRLHVL